MELRARALASEIALLATRFWLWWTAELAAMAALARARYPQVSPGGENPTVSLEKWGNHPPNCLPVAIATDPSSTESLPDAAIPNGKEITVEIAPAHVFRREIELPRVAFLRMRESVALQLDRWTPFGPDQARWDCRFAGMAPGGKAIRVELAAAPAEPFLRLEQDCAEAGIAIAAIRIAGDESVGAARAFDLARREPVLRRKLVRQRLRWTAIAAACWIIGLWAIGEARSYELASLESKIAELKPIALQSAALERDLASYSQRFDLARGAVTRSPLRLLATLSYAFPDDARLASLKLDGDALELSGVAVQPAGVVERLGGIAQFSQVHFTAPVSHSANGGERFELAARWLPK